MAFGIYVHIPYCLQRCSYCDFATYVQGDILPPKDYFQLLKRELQHRSPRTQERSIDTVYFGGGTPSLVPPALIVSFLKELGNHGFVRSPTCEITIEINPATISDRSMEIYLEAGINRFSVGAQTFDDKTLKFLRREHGAEQTRDTLKLLKKFGVNFSVDILFGLPSQTVDALKRDIDEAFAFKPRHVSPYCLTVPEGHPLADIRPPEGEQVKMFEVIHSELTARGMERYEISNYSLPGFESRHNLLYWTDQPYLGLGLSAHSYSKAAPWGVRYWNANSIGAYQKRIQELPERETSEEEWAGLPENQMERLKAHEALTDFCHTSLRRMKGLDMTLLAKKFGPAGHRLVEGPLRQLEAEGWVRKTSAGWSLTESGILVSNNIFRQMTFLPEEWAAVS